MDRSALLAGENRRGAADVSTAELLTDDQGFTLLEKEWNACVLTMPGANPCLTHSWLTAWRRTIGRTTALRVFLLRDRGELQAAAPLCLRRSRYYGVPVTELIWLGDQTSDRMQFLARSNSEAAAGELWRVVLNHHEGQTLTRLEEVPVDSPTDRAARQAGGRMGREESSTLPLLTLPDDWEGFVRGLPSGFRREMRTRTKVFDGWGAWERVVVRGKETAAHVEEIAAVERASPRGAAGRAFFVHRDNVAFISEVLGRADAALEPVLLMLRANGMLIGYNLGFIQGGVFCGYSQAYLRSHAKGSPGKWLMHEAIHWVHQEGLREFDFMRGAGQAKSWWRPVERRNCRLVVFRPGPIPGFLRLAVFGVRPFLKSMRRIPRSRA